MKRLLIFVITLFVLILNSAMGNADKKLFKVSGRVFLGEKQIGWEPGAISGEDQFYSGWTEEQFKGNNKLFREIRLAIRRINKTPGALKKRVPAFRQQAQSKPYDAVAQFRWVCADWVEHNYRNSPLIEWRNALARPLSPQSYDYARLRFLITAENARTMGKYASDERLKHVGERLMKIDPKDELVFYLLRQIKKTSRSLKDKWDNVRYAQNLVKAKPKDANAQAILGGAYLDLWMMTKQRSYGNMAIAQYNKYLMLAPKSASFREDAQFWIKSIPKDQARWEKKSG